jgi:ATP-dependent Clp protease protease subunit
MFTGEVNADTAQIAIAELLYLASVDDSKDITMYINSPGGSVVDGLAIYDTMRYIKPDVSTVVVGMAASMGSILLSGGAKGKRYALPNAEVMIHQPSGGSKGMASDMEIAWKQMERCKEKLTRYLVANSGRNPDNPDDYQKVLKDMDRDYWMTAQEALDYGLIDKIIELR